MLDEPANPKPLSEPLSDETLNDSAYAALRQDSAEILIYDAQCGFCRTLALRLQAVSRTDLSLLALSDPRAKQLLSRFYPSGWKHDFYLIKNGKSYRRKRSILALTRTVGVWNVVAALAEYARFKISSYNHRHQHAPQSAVDGDQQSEPSAPDSDSTNTVGRRRLLHYSAAAAGYTALSTLPHLADPFAPKANAATGNEEVAGSLLPTSQLTAYVSRAVPTDGTIAVTISECPECLHPAKEMKPQATTSQNDTVQLQRKISHEIASPSGKNFSATLGIGEFKIQSRRHLARFKKYPALKDVLVDVNMSTHQIALQDERYTLQLGVGRAVYTIVADSLSDELMQKAQENGRNLEKPLWDSTTVSGLVIHDVPVLRGDCVKYESAEDDGVERHLLGYANAATTIAEAVQYLPSGQSLRDVYKDIAAGFEMLQERWSTLVGKVAVPIHRNKVFITPFPEYLRYMSFDQQESCHEPPLDCGCEFGCDCCTGGACAVGCGFCWFPPSASCGLSCCAGGCSCDLVQCGCCDPAE